ncbi:unnamed protein product [Bursaphelenchus xylophilus]|uniref:(pine wood nematode) hypothetical protein n=1 Tax=Bursaphelenchus xylophilus TaxID=6326 RepID=A0A1I7RS89_BURXY|nr:unnamed protein product [Bursaphelenchus xylophilus]CAG9123116.1 unnamed protein product [Bursaphelenchus xylophilus]
MHSRPASLRGREESEGKEDGVVVSEVGWVAFARRNRERSNLLWQTREGKRREWRAKQESQALVDIEDDQQQNENARVSVSTEQQAIHWMTGLAERQQRGRRKRGKGKSNCFLPAVRSR